MFVSYCIRKWMKNNGKFLRGCLFTRWLDSLNIVKTIPYLNIVSRFLPKFYTIPLKPFGVNFKKKGIKRKMRRASMKNYSMFKKEKKSLTKFLKDLPWVQFYLLFIRSSLEMLFYFKIDYKFWKCTLDNIFKLPARDALTGGELDPTSYTFLSSFFGGETVSAFFHIF